jgi:nucleotide-binding universal stress UspA family protein
MPLISRILAPLDFSAPAGAAACYAAALASAARSRLTLFHAVEPIAPAFDYSMIGPIEQVLHDASEAREAQALEQLDRLQLPGHDVHRVLAEGDPAGEILKAADALQTDLIVMSTRGAGALQRVFGLGSVTLRVLGGAPCPVLTGIDFSAAPRPQGHTILCALDLGPSAPRTLQWAGQAAREFGARLAVVHATTLADKKVAGLIDHDWDAPLVQRLDKHFRGLLEAAGLEGDVVLDDGSVHGVVAKTAEALKASWVVIGRSASEDVLDRLRANTYDIVRRSPCPVVSV